MSEQTETTEVVETIDRIKPEPKTWWLKMWNGCVVDVYPFAPVEMAGEWIKVQEVQP